MKRYKLLLVMLAVMATCAVSRASAYERDNFSYVGTEKGMERRAITGNVTDEKASPPEEKDILAAAIAGNFGRVLYLADIQPRFDASGPDAEAALVSAINNRRPDIVDILLAAPYRAPMGVKLKRLLRGLARPDSGVVQPSIFLKLFALGYYPAGPVVERRLVLRMLARKYQQAPELKAKIDQALYSLFDEPQTRREQQELACPGLELDVQSLAAAFPIIFTAKASQDNSFAVDHIYKGPRIALLKKSGDIGQAFGGPGAYLVATAAARNFMRGDGCTHIYNLDGDILQPEAAQLLIDMSLYEAALNAKHPVSQDTAPRKDPYGNVVNPADFADYKAKADEIRKSEDYLYLYELATQNLLLALDAWHEPGIEPQDDWDRLYDEVTAYGDSFVTNTRLCVENPGVLNKILGRSAVEKLVALGYPSGRSMVYDILARYVSDIAYALLRKGDTEAALAALCYTRDAGLYLAAMKQAGSAVDVAGKAFGQIGNMRNLDLSRMMLAGGRFDHSTLADVNLAGADLRGASFRGTDLRSANLQGAQLQDAIYDCQTAFPPGFDVQAQGMNRDDSGYLCRQMKDR